MSTLPSHHLSNGRFQNPPGSPHHIARVSDFASFIYKQLTSGWKTPKVPKGHVIPARQARQNVDRHRGHEAITWLGHASFLFQLQGQTILTDPFLSARAGIAGILGPRRFAGPGLPVTQLPPIDVILLSHAHYDHLDIQTLQAIPNKERIEVVVPLRVAPLVRACGFKRVYELDWYDRISFAGIEYTALPAIHFSRRSLWDENKTLWASFSIRTPLHHLYFSGDTAYGKVFDEIGARMGPFDLALIGIGAYEPRRIMRPVHAAPEEAVQIGLDIRASTLVAMHWGTIVLSTEPPFLPPERFKNAGIDAGIPEDKLWVLKIGETRALPPKH